MSKTAAYFQGFIALTISAGFIAGLFGLWGLGAYFWGLLVAIGWCAETMLLVHTWGLRGPQLLTIGITTGAWLGLLHIF